jgi:hypothetical protein
MSNIPPDVEAKSNCKPSKTVTFSDDPPQVREYPRKLGTWAYDKPMSFPSHEAALWSTRQLHDAVEGQVHRYEPSSDLPELQEIEEDDWPGKYTEDKPEPEKTEPEKPRLRRPFPRAFSDSLDAFSLRLARARNRSMSEHI